MKLQAAIKYAEDDMKSCVEFVERSPSDDAAMEINKACILFKVNAYLLRNSSQKKYICLLTFFHAKNKKQNKKENKFEEALARFKKAQKIVGSKPGLHKFNVLFYIEAMFVTFVFCCIDISYNLAVCYFKLKQYDLSLKHIADIIEKGIKEHPGNFGSLSNDLSKQSIVHVCFSFSNN